MDERRETFGRYEVLDVIGRGGMGVVYRAVDPAIERLVAVKVLVPPPGLYADELAELRRRFQVEAKAVGMLSHPGIVVVYDVGEEGEQPFIAMELLDGEDLRSLLARRGRPVDLAEAADWLDQVAAALDHAHDKGVIHRDIKPANLFLTAAGHIKITDFGVARLPQGTVTRTGYTMGSPHYMAPEQVQGRPPDPRTDVFGLGATFFELLTGQRAFEGTDPAGVAFQVVFGERPRPSACREGLPEGLDAVFTRALAPEPADRFPRAGAFAEAFRAGVEGRGSVQVVASAGIELSGETLPVEPAFDEVRETRARPSAAARWGVRLARTAASIRSAATRLGAGVRRLGGRLARGAKATWNRLPRWAIFLLGVALALVPGWWRAPADRGLLTPVAPAPTATPTPLAPARSPSPVPSFAAVPSSATAGPTRRGPGPGTARILVHGSLPIPVGRVEVWTAGELLWSHTVRGEPSLKVGKVKFYKSSFRGSLWVPAGQRTIEVRITDLARDATYVGTIGGRLREGTTRRLDIGLGRLDREVELSWDD